jgi:hypothetical protein
LVTSACGGSVIDRTERYEVVTKSSRRLGVFPGTLV